MEDLEFQVAHIGINCPDEADALTQAAYFQRLFGISAQDGKDSVFAGPLLELMKAGGRGTHGHIAVSTRDIGKARAYLEEQGCRFDESSAKYDGDGNLIVLYLTEETAGFAVHLLQR